MRSPLALAFAVFSLLASHLPAQSTWTFGRTAIADVSQARAIAYGNGRFLAVLNSGIGAPSMTWSTDGATWNPAPLAPNADDLIFLAGAFYAVAGDYLLRSSDGESWQIVQRTLGHQLLRLATDGRGFLLGPRAAASRTLLYSPDRVTFRETAPLPVIPPPGAPTSSVSISDLACVNGRYFVTYTAEFPSAGRLLSRDFCASTTDGSTWTPVPALDSAVYLASGAGRMVAGGSFRMLWTSLATTDGVNFTPSSGTPTFYNGGKMRYAGGRFFFLGSFVASTDGLAWSPIASAPAVSDSRSWLSVAYGNGRYVAAGLEFTGPATSREVFATLVAPATPVIATTPLDRTAAPGSSTTFAVTIENSPAGLSYQWRHNGTAIAGATNSTLTLAAVKAGDAGRYTVEVRNSFGTTLSDVAFLTVGSSIAPPLIVDHPASYPVFAGQPVTFVVGASGGAPFTYQWFRNGVALPGATADSLTLSSPLPADTGDYTVMVSNAAGSVTSAAGLLRVSPVSRISNLSVLTNLTSGSDDFTVGYVIGGAGTTGSKLLVLRAAGPALGTVGVTGTLTDPKLETYAGSAKTGENDNWSGSATLANAFTSVGAFPFVNFASLDAGLVTALGAGDNSVKVTSANRGTGTVLAEVYDATPDAVFTVVMPRLLNVSVLKPIGSGLTVGFTLSGAMSRHVLIRAVGPTLANFGVANPLADPQLTVFNAASEKIAENDNWSGAGPIASGPVASTSAVVGAFALPATSKDAALLAFLPPGGYSVQVTGANNTTGTALVEVYEVP